MTRAIGRAIPRRVGAAELVRSLAARPVETVRRIPRSALTRIVRVLEDRGVLARAASEARSERSERRREGRAWPGPGPAAWEPAAPAEEMVVSAEVWGPTPASLPGVDLCVPRQLELLEQMRRFATDLPDFRAGSFRYRYNPRGSDVPLGAALSLNLMMRTLAPKRIFELGSDQGRAIMLDSVERSFGGKTIEITSIEPDVPREQLRQLGACDILYVGRTDLTHVLFEVLPALSAGVFIQLGDVFYPFRRADLVRAFLQYNREFQIRFWPSYLYQHCRDRLAAIPQICADTGTLWIRKVG